MSSESTDAGEFMAVDDDAESTDDRSKMTFLEHLDELRRRILYSLYVLLACCAVTFYFWEPLFRYYIGYFGALGGHLVFTQPMAGFMFSMKLSALAALIVSAPFIFSQAWLFVAPGLYAKEKKVVVPFVFFASIFFFTGAYFAHRIAFPSMWRFFTKLLVRTVASDLQRDPAAIYGHMDFASRDRYRHAVEEMAEPTGEGRVRVALKSVERARQIAEHTPAAGEGHVGYYLIDAGLTQLETKFHYQPPTIERLRRFLETAARVELQLPVEVVTTSEEVWRGQASEGQLRPVRAAADGGDDRRQAGSPRRLDRVLDEVRVIFQDVLDVPVEVLDLDADPDVRKKRLRF